MASIAVENPSRNGTHPIPPSILPQVAPSTYLLSHLISPAQRRPSGRQPSETRPISLNTGSLTNANGSALIRIGNTSVVCGVRAEILDVRNIANYRPKDTTKNTKGPSHQTSDSSSDSSDEDEDADDDDDEDDSEIHSYSLLVPNIELQTGASPLPPYQPSAGPPSTLAQSLSQRLLSLLHSTRLIRSSDLRIHGTDINSTLQETSNDDSGSSSSSTTSTNSPQILKAYWTLYLDILVLSHDGSIFDAAFMSLLSALQNTLLPKAWYDHDREQIICSPKTSDANHLRLRGVAPLPLSWRIFTDTENEAESKPKAGASGGPSNQKYWILLDPDAFEEDSGSCREGGCIVIDNASRQSKKKGADLTILKLEKNGGPSLKVEDLELILQVAGKRWKEWRKVLKDS